MSSLKQEWTSPLLSLLVEWLKRLRQTQLQPIIKANIVSIQDTTNQVVSLNINLILLSLGVTDYMDDHNHH